MRYLRTNTATRVTCGPFFDKTDGVTPEVAITVTACKLTLVVDTGGVPTLILDTAPTASGGNNDMVHITNDDAGFYDLELAAADVNYLGRAMLAITDAATHCPVFHEFMIVPANVYDSMFLGTDTLNADVTQIGGDTQSATDLKDFADAGYDPTTNKVEGVKLADTTTTNTDMRGTDSAALASVCTEARLAELDGANIPTDVANVKTDTAAILVDTGTTLDTKLNNIQGATFDTATDSLEALRNRGDAAWITATGFSTHTAADVWAVATRVLTAGTNIVLAKGTGVTGLNDLDAAGVAAATWNAATATYGSVGSYGLLVETNLDALITSRLAASGYTAPDNTGIADIKTEVLTHPTLGEIEASSVLAKEATLANATYGLAALKALLDAIDTSTELQARFTEIKGAGWTTETLKVIKDSISGGGTDPQVIRDAMKLAPTAGAPVVGSIDKHLDDIVAQTDKLQFDGSNRVLAQNVVALPVVRGQVYTATAFQYADVRIVKGDTPTITFDLGADYTGWTVWFGAKENLSDSTSFITPRQASWTDVANGVGQIVLTSVETGTAGNYYGEIELRSGSQRLTAIRYRLVIEEDVID